jgi:c-di-GMP-binding flagellar brake protein YcgR
LSDRRRYPRVQADILCRPAGSKLLHHRRNTRDISLGGIRVYTDEEFQLGSRLDLDIRMPDESSVRCWAVVVWSAELGDGAPARFDVGLQFTDLEPADIQRLAALLVRGR